MQYLLPLFLIFSFSAKAIGFSCFKPNSKNQPSPAELIRSQQIDRGMDLLTKELSDSNFSIDKILETLKTLKELDFSEDDINNVFIPVIQDPKFNKKGKLQDYIAQGQELAFSILDRYVTPYQALQLFDLTYILDNTDTTPRDISRALVGTGSFSKKEIIIFIIGVSNSYQYDFGKSLIDDLAYGQQIAHKILRRSATPEQALGLFFLDKDLKNVSKTSKIDISKTLEELDFSREDFNKLIDNSSDSGFKVKELGKLARGLELSLGFLGKKATPHQALGLVFLEEELLSNSSPVELLEILKQLKKIQGFSEGDINNVFIPAMLNPINKNWDLKNYIAQGQELARETLKRTVTSYQALQLFSLKDFLQDIDTTVSEVSEFLGIMGSLSKKEIIEFIIGVSNSYQYDFGKSLIDDLAYGQQIAHKILRRSVTPEQALSLFLLEKELPSNSKIPKSEVSETLEELGFSKDDINKLIDNSSDSGFKLKEADDLTQGQKLALGILGERVTSKQAQGLVFLEEELLPNSSEELLEILKQLGNKGFSEKEINEIFIPVILDPKIDEFGVLKDYVDQRHEQARKILGKKVTSYQAIKLRYDNEE